MRNSKFLLTSLLAAAAMSVPAFASTGDTVLINFNSDKGTSTAEGTWNDTTASSNTTGSALVDSSNVSTGMTATWTATGLWRLSDTGTGILNGYLDDNNVGSNVEIKINVSGVSYLAYDVTIYCAADGGANFSAKTVNGKTYTYSTDEGCTILGDSAWGALGTETATEGTNYLTISGQGGNLSISSLGDDVGLSAENKTRGNIAAIKIVDVSVAMDVSPTIGDSTWTNSSLAGTTWSNANATNGWSYANLTLAGDTSISVTEEGISTVAIIASLSSEAASANLTLSGNAVDMVASGTIKANTETSIVINNTLNFTNGGVISGNVSTGTNGLLNVAFGRLDVAGASSQTALKTSLASGATYVADFSSAAGTYSLANVSGVSGSLIEINANSSADTFTTISEFANDFSGGVKITGGYLNLENVSAIESSSVEKIVLSGGNASGLCFVRGAGLTITKNIVAEGSGGALRSYGYDTYTVTFSGTVTGTAIRHWDGGTHTFTNTVSLDSFSAEAGITKFSGASTTLGTLKVTGGTTIVEGNTTAGVVSLYYGGKIVIGGEDLNPTVSATRLIIHDLNSESYETLTIKSGTLTVTGGNLNDDQDGNAAVVIGDWGRGTQASVLNVEGGVVNAKNARTNISWDSAGELNICGGTYNAYGIAFGGGATNVRNNAATLNLSSGRLNVGAGGMTNYSTSANKTFTFTGGTLGAFADWSSSMAISLGGTATIDTLDSEDSTTARNITLNGLLSGDGALKKTGAGTLTLGGANSYSGGTTIEGGVLVAASASALGTNSVRVEGGQLKVSGVTLNQTAITVVLGEAYKAEGGVAALVGESGGLATGTTVTVDATDLSALGLVVGVANEYNIWDSTLTTDTMLELSADFEDMLTAGGWEYAVSEGVLTITAIPEPSTFGLLAGLGALALAGTRRRRRKA
ncbi:MAG: beta strand repeat-containing protein [Candidatus Spyradosoma sp.]